MSVFYNFGGIIELIFVVSFIITSTIKNIES